MGKQSKRIHHSHSWWYDDERYEKKKTKGKGKHLLKQKARRWEEREIKRMFREEENWF